MLTIVALCVIAVSAYADQAVGGGDDSGDDVPRTGEISGSISEDQSWSGTVTLIDETVIESGATVTVEPGTEVLGLDGVTLRVSGTFEVAGGAADPVVMQPT